MKIVKSIRTMSLISTQCKKRDKTIGFVPTMGALHDGHLSLIDRSHAYNDVTVASIFVNPLQFGPKEDFSRYPRFLRKDAALCRRAGVNYLFCPHGSAMYPGDFNTSVAVEKLSEPLCGRVRPGHFRGVSTVVAKLFNIVKPDVAYFGQKDFQQTRVIMQMVEDLNMDIEIEVMPIVREQDGLAMSSRNSYLDSPQRQDAVVLYEALKQAESLAKAGERSSRNIIARMTALIETKKTVKLEYIAVIDPKTLLPVGKISFGSVIALAARLGRTRLIDNIIIRL
jgi:pantoate--beta-alanine ligase